VAAPLDLATVRAYLRVPATALSDEDLQRMIDTSAADQSARCHWEPTAEFPVALEQALLRRVQREVAARNLPLGMVGLEAEYGPQSLATYDALVEQHERQYRNVVLA
jgi:hypothetical protein